MSIKVDPKHPAECYAREVSSGKIPASKWVKLAAKRHLRDLDEGHERGLCFDSASAQRAINFFGFLRHSKGEWAGRIVELGPWQQFILYALFGWKRADGTRRFRKAYVEVPKKNGKSTLCAGIGLYLLVADGEPGAEVYCAATKKDQAKIVFDEAVRMRAKSPAIAKRVQHFRNNLSIQNTASKFEPLGADADTSDGINSHGLIIDELHRHKTRAMLDILEGGVAARRQPLTWEITTAGSDRASVCWDEHEYAEKVLEGIFDNDEIFAYIATIDEGDDWTLEATWRKANPNYGISVKPEYVAGKCKRAIEQPSSQNAFLRLHLDVWTSNETAAIKADEWRKCIGFSMAGKDARSLRAEMEKQLEGRECYIAIDLSSTDDLSCSGKLFPPEDDTDQPYIFIPHFWLPEENLQKKIEEWRAPYDVWAREGFILTTEGNVIDYDAIEAQVLEDCKRYDVREITFDSWNATQFTNNLQKAGIANEMLVKFPQTIAAYAEPTKKLLETLIPSRKIAHLGNPTLAWMASNLVVKTDDSGNKLPTKSKGRSKIDGLVSLLMALGRSISAARAPRSPYETGQGIFTV